MPRIESHTSTRNGAAYLTVDVHEVQETIDLLRTTLTKEKFNSLMGRTFGETERKAKTLIKREVVKDYAVTQAWVAKHILRGSVSVGANVQCVIPISGARGIIGPRFKTKSWKKGKPISAKILKGASSILPSKMDHQGGNPPFMVNGTAYTRKTSESKPLVRVAGLGVPQMPLNRSADRVAEQLVKYMGTRLDHNFNYMFGGR